MYFLDINFVLEVDTPMSKHNFYSEDVISKHELEHIIMMTLGSHEDFWGLCFDNENLSITIDERKTLKFLISEDIDGADDYQFVNQRSLPIIKTRIIIDAQRSVPGTELCVAILQNLQRQYPHSVFMDSDTVAVGGNDIQKIWIDKEFLYKARDSLERISN